MMQKKEEISMRGKDARFFFFLSICTVLWFKKRPPHPDFCFFVSLLFSFSLANKMSL